MHNTNPFSDYEKRTIKIAQYMAQSGATVRQCSKKFGLSKSCIHKDICLRLEKLNPSLYAEVRLVLDKNKAERHLRGGIATKNKYMEINRNKNSDSKSSFPSLLK